MMVHAEGANVSRSPGPSYQEFLESDTHPVADHFRESRPGDFGTEKIPVERYTSRDFYEREKAELWPRVWQMACRSEHVPEAGDTYLYEICDSSFLIVRNSTNEINAFWNVCRHRGRQLVSEPGHADRLRCPFHAFTWNLDGKLAFTPSAWDFPQIGPGEADLLQVRVAVWAGFVFINPDLNAEPLDQYLGEIVEHFEPWRLEDRFVEGHVAKVIHANWKAVQEAFMESLHVAATHPQQLMRLGDTNSQHDCYENVNRSLHPSGTPSPLLDWIPTQQQMLESMLDVRVDEQSPIVVPDGMSLREFAANVGRDSLRPALGDEVEQLSDAELVDAMEYSIFPNFHPWAAYQRVVYRFRPYQDRHDQTIMEVMLLSPYVGDRPPPADCVWLDADQSWTDAPVLGITGRILDQDSFNLPRVQVGMQSTPMNGLLLSRYQESRIRHFHRLLECRLSERRPS